MSSRRRSRHPGARTNRLYKELAYLWPIISPPEEYGGEAAAFVDIIYEKLGRGRYMLLELGVGGGHMLSHLTADFECTAVDLSPDMLALSQGLNPGVEHHVGDTETDRRVALQAGFSFLSVGDAVAGLLNGLTPQ